MNEDATLVLLLAGLLALAVLYVAWRAYEWKLVWWGIAAPFWLSWKLLKLTGFLGSRAMLRVGRARTRVLDPTTAEIVEREAVVPNRTPMIQELRHGFHWTQAGLLKAVHKVTIAEAGAGKGQTGANYEIQYQLEYSDENLVILEVKPNMELSQVVYAHARPTDRIWEYTLQPKDRYSSALTLGAGELTEAAYSICTEPEARDGHWNAKSVELIPQAAFALGELVEEAERAAAEFAGSGAGRNGAAVATLNDVRDVVADRRRLEELRLISPAVDNVSDSAKEWGYIRSNSSRHLSALSEMRVRRVFAGRDDTPQPTFAGYPNGGRDIVIVRPDEASAAREARYVVALMDVLIRRAVAAGHAGGARSPGTKVIADEFASFMDLSKMRRYLDLGRGGRTQFSYYLQGLGQLAAAVGEGEAKSIISSTELKVIGSTSDTMLADLVSKLARPTDVEFRGARRGGELAGDWERGVRPSVSEYEILSQGPGEWTVVHRSEIRKVRVPEEHYHHTQAAPPREHQLWGVVNEEDYEVPPILGPAPEEDEDGGERRRRRRYDDDDLEDAPTGEDEGGWID